MRLSIIAIIDKFLSEKGVPHTPAYIEAEISRLPFSDSLWAIHKVLDKYMISNSAYKLRDKDYVEHITTPFLTEYRGKFILVTTINHLLISFILDGKNHQEETALFKKDWGGIVLEAKVNEFSAEPDYKEHLISQRFGIAERIIRNTCVFTLLLACFFDKLGNHSHYSFFIPFFLNLIGLGLSLVLLRKDFSRKSEEFAQFLCNTLKFSKRFQCATEKKESFKFLGKYKLSELGIAYFGLNVLLLLSFPYTTTALPIFAVAALPVSIWSISYQKRHSWCALCIMVVCLTWVQFLCYVFSGTYPHTIFSLSYLRCLVLTACGYLIALHLTYLYSKQCRQLNSLDAQLRQYKTIKFNKNVFESLLYSKSQSPFPNSDSASSLVFGKRRTNTPRITVFSNPFCNPCARMHKRLQSLVNAGFEIQYILTSFGPKYLFANRLLIATYLYKGADTAWEKLTDWYNNSKLINVACNREEDNEVETELTRHMEWEKLTGIHSTPTILIDGFPLPESYEIEELLYIY